MVIGKKCSKCKDFKLWSEFAKKTGRKDGHTSHCLDCMNRYNAERSNSFDGFLMKKLMSSRKNSKDRLKKGRIEAGVHNITIQDLRDLWELQEGKCFYSGLPLNYGEVKDWSMSLERLDPSKGYTKDNIAFVAGEFNGSSQWSIQKIHQIPTLVGQPSQLIKEIAKLDEPKIVIKRKINRNLDKIIDNILHKFCIKCNSYKPKDEFLPTVTGCKSCRADKLRINRTRIDRWCKKMASEAQKSTKTRNSKGRNLKVSELSFTDLLQKVKEQIGLCYYSGIPMRIPTAECEHPEWLMSLERLDSTIGYTKENTVLICIEFNTFDRSVCTKYGDGGSSAWSREKFLYFYRNCFGIEPIV